MPSGEAESVSAHQGLGVLKAERVESRVWTAMRMTLPGGLVVESRERALRSRGVGWHPSRVVDSRRDGSNRLGRVGSHLGVCISGPGEPRGPTGMDGCDSPKQVWSQDQGCLGSHPGAREGVGLQEEIVTGTAGTEGEWRTGPATSRVHTVWPVCPRSADLPETLLSGKHWG